MSDADVKDKPAETKAPAKKAPAARGRPPRQAEEKQRRRRRSDMSLGRLSPLDLPDDAKDPKYVYRWVSDEPGRIKQLTEHDDYDFVTQEQVGERSDKEKSSGSHVERPADRISDKRMILLRKPKEFYDEDQAKKQAHVDEIDNVIRQGGSQSPEGLHGANAYVPEGGIKIGHKG